MKTTPEKSKGTFLTDAFQIKNREKRDSIIEKSPKRFLNIQKPIEEVPQTRINYNIKEFQKKDLLYEKILYHPKDMEEYSHFPITPGVNFIKKMFSHDQAERAVTSLKINIPETYWNDAEIFFVFNDPEKCNQLTLIKNKKDFDLFKTFITIETSVYKRELANYEPLYVIRLKENEYENIPKIERMEKAEENLNKDLGENLVQRYIRSRGRNRDLNQVIYKPRVLIGEINKNLKLQNAKQNQNDENYFSSGNEGSNAFSFDENINSKHKLINLKEEKKKYTKPAIVRLEFKTRYNSSKKPNIGYYLVNKNYMEPQIMNLKSKEFIEKYSPLCTLQTSNKNSFKIYVMTGDSLKEYEFYANEIVSYVQKWFKLLLNSIVIDFIKDERGIIYFLGVKAFTPVQNLGPTKLNSLSTKDYIKDEKNINKLYKTWTCRLCQISYPKDKINKIVTFKLILNLIKNLEKRNGNIFKHINDNIYNESRSCRICDLCYKLLITEQEICEIQKAIAICNNINVTGEDDSEAIKIIKVKDQEIMKYKYKFDTINQWRILFYFIRFYMIDLGKIDFSKKRSFKLYIKLFDQKMSFPIFDEVDKFKSSDEVEINLSKIFYFFTQKLNTSSNQSLKQFFKNEEVDFRIVIDDDWNNPLAQCQTMCLSFFEPDSETLRVKNTLNFFSSEMKHFKCQVYIGLKNDYEIVSNDINFYSFDPSNLIYLTHSNYYSYHAFPSDWYELFLPQDYHIEEEDNDYDLDLIIDRFINEIEFNDKKRPNLKEEVKEEIYDPYDTLMKIENKKEIITKIKSIPMIQDKDLFYKRLEDKKLRPSTSGLFRKLKLGNLPLRNNDDKESVKNEDNVSSASYRKNQEKFENDLSKKITNLDKNILNPENEIVKNYGSFNSIADINKLTNQMAFNKANLNTNENFYSSKKSNVLGKVSSKKNEFKKHSPQNIGDSSDSSNLSSLDSNLNYYDNLNKKIQIESEPINKKNPLLNKNKENEFDVIDINRINNILNRIDDKLNDMMD